MAITAGGSLYTWGCNTNGQLGTGALKPEAEPVVIDFPNSPNLRIIDVAGGGFHSLAVSKYVL